MSRTARIWPRDWAARGVTEPQVQVVWMKVAHSQPRSALADADADARLIARRVADIARRRLPGWRGPYLWANGSSPQSDGLSWLIGDFQNDGTHPSQSGQQKVGRELLQFFKTSPVTRCWFLAAAGC
jgi:hypothetical protein